MGEISEALRQAREKSPEKVHPKPASPGSMGADISRGNALRGESLAGSGESQGASESSPGSGEAPGAESPSGLPIREVLAEAKEAERAFEEPLRQSISREPDDDRDSARACIIDPHCDAAQGYRKLAFRIHSRLEEADLRSLVVTSTLAREGKTTTACNLAVELARVDHSRRVVLVEMDMRRPMVANSLKLNAIVGVDDVLSDKAEIAEALVRTDVDGLDVMMVREPVMNPTSHFSSHRLTRFIRELESRYAVVLIDTPPLVVGTDATVILRHADAGLLVAAAGVTPSRRVKQVIAQLPQHKIIGSVLNYARSKTAKSEYDAYYYAQPEDSSGAPDRSPQQ